MKHNKLFVPAIAAALGFTALQASAQVYPSSVTAVSQGFQKNGGAVSPFRSNTANALGMPQDDDTQHSEAADNFYSLGFGGYIVLAFPSPVGKGAGNDVDLFETSYGNPSKAAYPEHSRVDFSQDGVHWVAATAGGPSANGDGGSGGYLNYGVEIPGVLGYANYIRITDISVASQFGASDADGWDVDGVRANYDAPPVQNGPCPADAGNSYMSFLQGTQKNGAAIPAARSDASKSTGTPQASDVTAAPNFVSLGFDNPLTPATEGQITIRFNGTVFDDGTSAADLHVYETTWGDGPTWSDAHYPEIALFEGSIDGVNWTTLTAVGEAAGLGAGQVVRDGYLDISNMPLTDGVRALMYVRVTDKSIRSSSNFPGSADGYDLDGITPCLTTTSAGSVGGRYDLNAQIGESEVALNTMVAPNPSVLGSKSTISFEANNDGFRSIDLYDITGKKVTNIASGDFAAGSHSIEWTASAPSNGLYMIRISGADASDSKAIRVTLVK